MLSSLTSPNLLLSGLVLTLLQVVAALPWLRAIDPRGFRQVVRTPASLLTAAGLVLAGALAVTLLLGSKADSDWLPIVGRVYGAVLHLQLLIALFLGLPALLTLLLPKTGAVASAAYREGWRQPLFWLIAGFAVVATWVSVVTPYFTFGDDFKMMKQIGFDIVMLAAVLFGVLASSISISEEIEGRTALTVMSKPVGRRQFLLGKYLGVLMACGGMTLLLGLNFNAACLATPEFDKINADRAYDQMPEEAKLTSVPLFEKLVPPGPARPVMNRAGMWFGETFVNTFGLLLGFGQVMVLVAVATALATRLPFIINIVLCLIVYFLGHLAPVVVRATESAPNSGDAGVGLARFLGQLFDTLLPSLEFFNMGPAIIREAPLGLMSFVAYSLTVTGYAAIYTAIALLAGLIFFEERDLA